ncbi:AAA family ATPase [Limosilactobacillus fermentum]|uniref:Helicase n=1 Tax=Limosilactobacillus fermentum 3872 TaxID=1381124 RepID=A0A806T3L4_LIMFE|nr:ATP-dependent RecD-like DNA helicase [Limosilactobacillus fermentum]AKM50967.1 helicase [Limosilactobacillus fermentum 3872]KAB1962176.1 AAA family ATPase [Limosilactobacillus fermentum]
MLKVDKAILDTNRVICANISQLSFSDRGLLSQNILGQIRNFVEYIAIKACSNGQNIDPNDYNLNVQSLKDVQRRGDLRFLYQFHEMLQKSVSHYTVGRDGSERLMLKYYEHLLKIKLYLKQTFNLDVLENISDFPMNTDTELSDYYEKIAKRIEFPSIHSYPVTYNDRYYVQKVKPFFVNQKIYYEITFTAANANASKFDRIIAFTQQEIVDNYAVKFSIRNDIIHILNIDMPILVINGYEVSIRPCEWDNFSEIFGSRSKNSSNSNEYKRLMEYISSAKLSLTELVSSDQDYYDSIKKQITGNIKSTKIYKMLDQCRKIIVDNDPGANVLRYLLYKMNNRVIRQQYSREQCHYLSNLYLSYSCIPFDNMPYCTSLRRHNPKLYDLFNSIPISGHKHELFARYIKNNTEIEGHLFTPKSEVGGFEDVDNLIEKYNSSLYSKHSGRRIEEYKDHLYIRGYVDDSTNIIKTLQKLASSGVSQYTASVDSWISEKAYTIDDEGKKKALQQMFANSHVALIYGPAGTGKSTLIKHISNFWANKHKIFLANTHPAVDNMRRMVTAGNSDYNTIAKFLSRGNNSTDCDVLFMDECSTVSNDDMQHVLKKAKFKLLVLVGDIYQIESIYFGNWFSIAQNFVPKTSIFELTHPYRTTDSNLLTVWKRVRQLDGAVTEPLVKNNYVERLSQSIFEHSEEDEIILCLNYDGLYGINNINRLLQSSNPNKRFIWGMNAYKVGDPILFNESNIFSPLIHNNSKGRIVGIRPEDNKICFEIELDESLNEIDALPYDFKLIGESKEGNSIILFSVNKFRSTDEDDEDDDSTIVPFQIAYAVSIHKAQGLEYDSVKIVITNETEESITQNIFYTAITRAKNKLKIYWSPETEQSVLGRFKSKYSAKDAHLLSKISSINMVS